MLPGNLNRAPTVTLSRAPGQTESCSRATRIVLLGSLNRAPSSLNRAPGQPIVFLGNGEHISKESLHTGARVRARARAPRATDRWAPIENPIYSQGKLRTYKINLLGKNQT